MKNFMRLALLAALVFCVAGTVSATELKVKGDLNVYGIWSKNLRDFDSETADGDHYMTNQRFRTWFTYQSNANLKAVLGLETNVNWGVGDEGDWGTDGTNNLRVKHTYLDFNFPDTKINVKAGLQNVALPGVFGSPVFNDDAAALVVSAPINEMFGLTVGYTRGVDNEHNNMVGGKYKGKDDVDAAFLLAPVTLDGFEVTPYFAYAWIGENSSAAGKWAGNGARDYRLGTTDDTTAWVLGANAVLKMFDPFKLEADLIYGQGKCDDYDTKGWYAALAASYKFDMVTPQLFFTYATGADKDADKDNWLPALREGWDNMTPYLGGARAFSTGLSGDGFATGSWGVGQDGRGLWILGLTLDKISFVENLSHKLTVAYAQGTSDKECGLAFDEKDSAWEVYVVNKYMIYENLAAINEIGFFKPDYDDSKRADDSSWFTAIGFQYKF